MTTTLLLGGNGKTGSRVAARLRELGRPVRIGSRTGDPRFDWADDTTWAPALRGVESAYISYYPDVSFPGAAERVGAFAKTAVKLRPQRLLLPRAVRRPDHVNNLTTPIFGGSSSSQSRRAGS